MAALLFVDLLGVRARWHAGGRPAAEDAFRQFRGLVLAEARKSPAHSQLTGAIESDAAALSCPTAVDAVDLVKRIYRTGFKVPSRQEDFRTWMRGVVVPVEEGVDLRTVTTARNLPGIQDFAYAGPLLDAIAVERSGFKGMRVLIDDRLVDRTLKSHFEITTKTAPLIPFKKLGHSGYPKSVAGGFQDFFWMAAACDEWGVMERQMTKRLRWSAKDSEEFVHAAATQVVFHEVLSIKHSLENAKSRPKRRRSR